MPLPNTRLTAGLVNDNKQGPQITTSWPNSDATYATGNLVNQNQVAEGPSIPPPQSGQFRVPRPSAFRVTTQTPTAVGEIISFAWLDAQKPITEVAGYRIFAKFSYTQNQEPTQIGGSSKSPCIARITADTVGTVVFYLQPYLLNGLTLPLLECPTCTTSITSPVPPAGTTPGGVVEIFDMDDTWTCPAGVTSVFVQCWGSGGNGGNLDGAAAGGGGGGGAYAASTIGVSPASMYTISVAVGGSGPGVGSYFDTPTTVFADSASDGMDAADPVHGAGGAGGSAFTSIGASRATGGSGFAGDSPIESSFGGGAGNGGGETPPGSPAAAPGGGGAGGVPMVAGAEPGASGRVALTYTVV